MTRGEILDGDCLESSTFVGFKNTYMLDIQGKNFDFVI